MIKIKNNNDRKQKEKRIKCPYCEEEILEIAKFIS